MSEEKKKQKQNLENALIESVVMFRDQMMRACGGRPPMNYWDQIANALKSSSRQSSTSAEWGGTINVGIYSNRSWSIRLYADRAIVRMPGVKWTGNTGGYHLYRTHETGCRLTALLALANREHADSADYTDEALEIVSGY